VDDGADGTAGNSATPGRGTTSAPGSAVSILNEGTITGVTGYAIRLAGNFNDTIIDTGTINSNVDMGDGNDSMIVRGTAVISTIPVLDGGSGSNDSLTFDAWAGRPGASIINWEKINLTNASTVDLPNSTDSSNPLSIAFTTLTIDSTSTLLADGDSPGFYTLVGDINNSGTISLSDKLDAGDRLTINGNYVGNSGTIKLDLNASAGTSDKVVISGTANGTTNVVLNTIGDGRVITPSSPITLISVGNAAASDAHAFSFSLASPLIGAGVYDPQISYVNGVYSFASYHLNHYLEEAALLQAITSSVERLDFESVTGFHERHAYSKRSCGTDVQSSALWVRSYGSSFRLDQEGDAATSTKGYSFGTQIGADLFTGHSGKSSQYHLGIFAGKGYQKANVNGIRTDKAGEISQQIFTMGMYGSIERPGCFYLEGVLQAGHHDLEIKSPDEQTSLDKHLWSMVASLETGVTLPLTTSIEIEPKVQAIYQHAGNLELATQMGTVTIRDHDGLQTRLGATGTLKKTALPFNPFLEVELIRDFSNDSKSYYSDSGITLSSNPEATHVGGAIGIASGSSGKKSLAYYVKAGAHYGVEGDGSYDYVFAAGLTRSF
jgi:outer membrane autotransporter protein